MITSVTMERVSTSADDDYDDEDDDEDDDNYGDEYDDDYDDDGNCTLKSPPLRHY